MESFILKMLTKKNQSFHGILSIFLTNKIISKLQETLKYISTKKHETCTDFQAPQANSQGHLSNSDTTNQEVDLFTKVS